MVHHSSSNFRFLTGGAIGDGGYLEIAGRTGGTCSLPLAMCASSDFTLAGFGGSKGGGSRGGPGAFKNCKLSLRTLHMLVRSLGTQCADEDDDEPLPFFAVVT